jgi:hypothetical protein
VAHAHRPPAHLAHDGEGLRQQVVERLALARALAQPGEALAQLFVGLELQLGLEAADDGDALLVLAELLGLADVQRTVEEARALSVAAEGSTPGPFGRWFRG